MKTEHICKPPNLKKKTLKKKERGRGEAISKTKVNDKQCSSVFIADFKQAFAQREVILSPYFLDTNLE